MGPTPLTAASPRPIPAVEQAWMELVQAQVTGGVMELLALPDEVRLDAQWACALEQVRAHVAALPWRGRAALLLAGHCLARGSTTVPARLWRFAAGLELLYVSQALHDDVRGPVAPRWGEPSLFPLLAPGRTGEHLAVVVGDHLFARALETMVGTTLPGASEASQYCLRLWRCSTAGVYRMQQGGGLMQRGGVRQALRHARLRMVQEGLATSLVCGAMLAGADDSLRLGLARVGCGAGLALRLREELDGFAGPNGDFALGRCSFPLMAAWSRARPEVREELQALWALPAEARDAAVIARAGVLVEEAGGRSATERLMARSAHGAVRALALLPNPMGLRELVWTLIGRMLHPMVPRGEAP